MKVAYCFHCRKKIEVKRRGAKNYCSPACKQAEYRLRKGKDE